MATCSDFHWIHLKNLITVNNNGELIKVAIVYVGWQDQAGGLDR